MKVVFIYVTVSSEPEARVLAEAMVAERLAACANIIPGMKSVYRWEGKVGQADEVVVILKTRAALFKEVEARVKQLHSATTPCIVALPVMEGNDDFLQWILAATKG